MMKLCLAVFSKEHVEDGEGKEELNRDQTCTETSQSWSLMSSH